MIRRSLTLLATVGLLASAGCAAGPDGPEAQRILDQVAEASKNIESMSYAMKISGEAAGQTFSMTIDGAGYTTGEAAGDMVMNLAIEAPGVPLMRTSVLARDGQLFVNLDGTWQAVPGGLTAEQLGQLQGQLDGLDFASFVRDVKVEKDVIFLGEPVTKVAGTLDVVAMMESVGGQIGEASGLGSLTSGLAGAEQALGALSDARAVLYVSDITHLVKAMHVEFEVEEQGQTGTFAIDYALRSVDQPVTLPEPALVA
jgi:hypothetical protein